MEPMYEDFLRIMKETCQDCSRKAIHIQDCRIILWRQFMNEVEDCMEYPMDAVGDALDDFQTDCKLKKLGIVQPDKIVKCFFISQKEKERPQYQLPTEWVGSIEGLCDLINEWFDFISGKYQEEEINKTVFEVRELGLLASQQKLKKSAYVKRQIKQCRAIGSIFRNELFRDFDFREISLQNAIFIGCDLRSCNFSHVNLMNALFVDCKLEGAVFYQAVLSGCQIYQGCEVQEISDSLKMY